MYINWMIPVIKRKRLNIKLNLSIPSGANLNVLFEVPSKVYIYNFNINNYKVKFWKSIIKLRN